jgi:hypothetical protein
VPLALREKIYAGEYIDFKLLLKENLLAADEGDENNMAIDRKTGTLRFTTGPKVKLNSIERWLDAYEMFMSVAITAFPAKAQQYIAYQGIVRHAASHYMGGGFLRYDEAFRKLASANSSLSWAEMDNQLWMMTFHGRSKPTCNNCMSPAHLQKECPLNPTTAVLPWRPSYNAAQTSTVSQARRPGQSTFRQGNNKFCYQFNEKQGCSFPDGKCRFKHVCAACQGGHPEYKCRKEKARKDKGKMGD